MPEEKSPSESTPGQSLPRLSLSDVVPDRTYTILEGIVMLGSHAYIPTGTRIRVLSTGERSVTVDVPSMNLQTLIPKRDTSLVLTEVTSGARRKTRRRKQTRKRR